jgi:hypothetical protein
MVGFFTGVTPMRRLIVPVAFLALVALGAAASQNRHSIQNTGPPPLVDQWATLLGVNEYIALPELYLEDHAIPLGDGLYLFVEPPEWLESTDPLTLAVAERSGPSVTCGSGWYACCYCVQRGDPPRWVPVARCRQNSTQDDSDCQAGGRGSTSCSLPKEDCAQST